MKLIGLTAAVALAFAGCSKQTITRTDEEPTPRLATPIPSTPEPIAAATPAPAPPELAPEGVFYLIAAARVETADGVRGLPPGTGVKLVRPGVYLTPSGEVPLAEEQLTNNLAVARAARDAALATQAVLQHRGNADAAVAAQQSRATAAEVAATQAANLKAIDRQRGEAQLAALTRQKIVTEEQIELLRQKKNREVVSEIKGRVVTSTTDQQLAAARAQVRLLEEQIAAAARALRAKP